MGVRSTLSSLLSGPATRLLERELRELVDDVLASRPLAQAADLEALRAEVAASQAGADDPRVAALEAEVESLKKRLGMAMGALQASTAQLMQVKQAAEEALSAARQAHQHATSAKAAAESAVDGVAGVEERLDALEAEAPAARAAKPAPSAPKGAAGAGAAEPAEVCRVPGCTNKHRARGFCARHYQQFRRSTLEGFVGPDGVLMLDGETIEVGEEHAGKHAHRDGERLVLEA